ncbi:MULTISPECIES: molybdopterin-dependent oxidoreductase [Thermus]|jgi:thiosulfate reductase/polysulfide reductase chain A|uniref:Molybdopterin oxidoreductase n=1 Tax=Thermus brockianus TaxID=56956 RepID=A0A1J0LTQ9_THEBO|nr:molybdopterin-dependent oxidoreductase [Thermus brockianus]APD09793.1 molybdopterin oxidoreductase [Thermus brockianus]
MQRREFLKLSALGAGALALRGSGPAKATKAPWYAKEVRSVYQICEGCFWRCGIVAHAVGNRVYKVEGYEANPKSRGRLCPRGQGMPQTTYDPDRLKRPLIRVEGSSRGEGRYRVATWEEALDYVAQKMLAIKEAYGPEAIAFFGHGTGDTWFVDYLPAAWGSPNAAKPSVSLCTAPREVASQWVFGRPIGGHEPVDWENTRYIVLVGHHIGEDTHNTQLQDFAQALKRGAKLVVVDPRFSTTAAKAHRWLPIKPGTDTALLLAWIHVLIYEGLYDREYVEKYTLGFDELKAHVKDLTPEWAEKYTEIPAETIRQVAREMAAHRPQAVLPPTRHNVWYGNDTYRVMALLYLNVLLGNYGRPGGFYIAQSPYLEKYPTPPLPLEPAAGGCSGPSGGDHEPEGFKPRADKGKFFANSTAIQELIEPMLTGEPYPIKGLIAYGINLFHSIPNVPRTKEALKKLDLYVAIDVLPQEHVMWADVILPEATYLERYDDLVAVAHKTPFLELRVPAHEPLFDTKPGWWIARELGLRLGLEAYFPWKDIEEYLNTRLQSIGLDLETLKSMGTLIQKGKPWLEDWEKEGRLPFGTTSGKIELYCQRFKEAGHSPLPVFTPPEDPPEGFYRLLYGRSPVHTFARTQNNWVLMEMDPENEVWIHKEEARKQGLKEGDYVYLENQDGVREGPVRVKPTERIRRDCVYLVHGFGHKAPLMKVAHGRGASDNYLQTRYTLDPISGGAGLRVNFVRLEKANPPQLPALSRLAKRPLDERRL